MSVEKRRKERHRKAPSLPETRQYTLTSDQVEVEVRSIGSTDGLINIRGQAVVWGAPYEVVDHAGAFTEVMDRSVGESVMSRDLDCRLLVGHDHASLPLARTTSGTMRLFSSPTGLGFEAQLDSRSQIANDVSISLSRGDVTGLSVGFVCGRDRWNDTMTHRTVEAFSDLPEISIVAFPCSPTTSVAVRDAMRAALPVESRARLRRLFANAKANAGRLSEGELVVVRELLYGGVEDDKPASGEAQRKVDPTVLARMQLESSRRHRTQRLQQEFAKRQRRRPSV